MSQHADLGVTATKPYVAGGAYINAMTDYCCGCRFNRTIRVGDDACPFTAGYWWYRSPNRLRLQGSSRIIGALGGLDRLRDLDELVAREERRGSGPP